MMKVLALSLAALLLLVPTASFSQDDGSGDYSLFDQPADDGDYSLGVPYDDWFKNEIEDFNNEFFGYDPLGGDLPGDGFKSDLGIDYSFFDQMDDRLNRQFAYSVLSSRSLISFEDGASEWWDANKPGPTVTSIFQSSLILLCGSRVKACVDVVTKSPLLQMALILGRTSLLMSTMKIDAYRNHFLREVIDEQRSQGGSLLSPFSGELERVRIESERWAAPFLQIYDYQFKQ
jgi:hypothetical protein